MDRVCLIDVSLSAHSSTYLSCACKSVAALGLEPIVITDRNLAGRGLLSGPVIELIQSHGSRISRLKNAIRLSKSLRSVQSVFSYHVTVTDHSLLGYGLLHARKTLPEFAHWMHGPTVEFGQKLVADQYKKTFFRNWAFEIGHFFPQSINLLPVPVHKFPDITNVEMDNDNLSQSAPAAQWSVGIIGNMSKYKGLLEFIRTATLSSAALTYLVAGNIPLWIYSESEQKIISLFLAQQNVTCIHGYINDGNEINRLLANCKVVWVAYNNFPHSSNILVKCAHFGVPVIANNYGLIGSAVCEYRLGVFLNTNFDECLESLNNQCLGGSEYAAQNSQVALSTLFVRLLESVNS